MSASCNARRNDHTHRRHFVVHFGIHLTVVVLSCNGHETRKNHVRCMHIVDGVDMDGLG
jgi:hypothetical protein